MNRVECLISFFTFFSIQNKLASQKKLINWITDPHNLGKFYTCYRMQAVCDFLNCIYRSHEDIFHPKKLLVWGASLGKNVNFCITLTYIYVIFMWSSSSINSFLIILISSNLVGERIPHLGTIYNSLSHLISMISLSLLCSMITPKAEKH